MSTVDMFMMGDHENMKFELILQRAATHTVKSAQLAFGVGTYACLI